MTQVKLTENYINNIFPKIKALKPSSKDYMYVPDGQSFVEGEHFKTEDLIADPANVPVHDSKYCLNVIGYTAIECYSCNCGETMEIPESELKNLIGIVKKVS